MFTQKISSSTSIIEPVVSFSDVVVQAETSFHISVADIELVDYESPASLHKPKRILRSFLLRPAIWIALVIHVGLLIILQHYRPSKLPSLKEHEVVPIQTYLYTPENIKKRVKPLPLDIAEADEGENIELENTAEKAQEKAPPASEGTDDFSHKPALINETSPTSERPEKNVVESTTLSVPSELVESAVKTEVKKVDSLPPIVEKKVPRPTQNTADLFNNTSVLGEGVSRYLGEAQEQAVDALSKGGAAQYQEKKGTVDLPEFQFERKEYGIGEVRPQKVNCDSSLNQGIAVLSGFLGGNVKCSNRKDFQKFIDQRREQQPQAGNKP